MDTESDYSMRTELFVYYNIIRSLVWLIKSSVVVHIFWFYQLYNFDIISAKRTESPEPAMKHPPTGKGKRVKDDDMKKEAVKVYCICRQPQNNRFHLNYILKVTRINLKSIYKLYQLFMIKCFNLFWLISQSRVKIYC